MLAVNNTGVHEVQHPKFKVGDKVHCYRKDTDFFHGFDFHGVVETVKLADDEYEYKVSNAPSFLGGFPLLIWESEMTKED